MARCADVTTIKGNCVKLFIQHPVWSWLGVIAGIISAVAAVVAVWPEGRHLRIMTCEAPVRIQPGEQIRLDYSIDATVPSEVGLGVGLYDSNRNDHSAGAGDDDRLQLEDGRTSGNRQFVVPAGLEPGVDDLILEIWPADRIGADNEETIAEHRCAIVRIP